MTATLQARPTTYKGIQMRSRLEAGFAAWLDLNEFDWLYEPRAYGSPGGQYLPDFQINDLLMLQTWGELKPRTTYIETKPHELFLDQFEDIQARMLIILESEPESRLMVVTNEVTVIIYPNLENELVWTTCSWAMGWPPFLTFAMATLPLQNEYWKP